MFVAARLESVKFEGDWIVLIYIGLGVYVLFYHDLIVGDDEMKV